MSNTIDPSPSEDDALNILGKVRSDVLVPGYWATIAQNSEQWAKELSAGPFWNSISDQIDAWHSEYKGKTGANLLSQPFPSFVHKKDSSIRAKMVRRVRAEPQKASDLLPSDGPPIPALSDLVRARLVCSYLDGVEFLGDRLVRVATDLGLFAQRERQGRIEGYYAQHVTLEQSVFFREGTSEVASRIRCEVQLASQMATQMWETSHSLYERLRELEPQSDHWQWDPRQPQFLSNQLGHMIHLADGLLVQLRDSLKGS